MKKLLTVGTIVALAALPVVALPVTSASADEDPTLAEAVQTQLALGLQTAPKSAAGPTARSSGTRPPGANPFLGHVLDATEADYFSWSRYLAAGADKAEAARDAAARKSTDPAVVQNMLLAAATPIPVGEQEAPGTIGDNDTAEDAELVQGLGTGRRDNARAVVAGTLAEAPVGATNEADFDEDDGAIPLSNDTGVSEEFDVMTTSAEVGDGPHGSEGTGTGDFDFYEVTAAAGETVVAETTVSGGTDTVAFLYDDQGALLATNDDGGVGLASLLQYQVPADGTYHVMVSGFGFGTTVPADPFDPASGLGVGSEGPYDIQVAVTETDVDYYAVDLRPGDVLGTSFGGGAGTVQVFRPDGTEGVGSSQDLSSLYPPASPLPGGGNAVAAYVVAQEGRHHVAISNGTGSYTGELEVYRAGLEVDGARAVQTIFLDFDGERLNTAVFGGPGVRTLSPLSSYLAGWGLTPADEPALVDAITAEVQEDLEADLSRSGLNRFFDVEVLNSKDDADRFLIDRNVSRVVVGGSIAESGISTIGIAQYIDPGNFGHEADSIVLLDLLSTTAGNPNSINTFITEETDDVIEAVAQGVGNITAHEAGHFLGNYHTFQFNEAANIMDQGGALGNIIGVGPDDVIGTADDVDVDFGRDVFVPSEGLTGVEDTLTNTEFGLTRGRGAPQ